MESRRQVVPGCARFVWVVGGDQAASSKGKGLAIVSVVGERGRESFSLL